MIEKGNSETFHEQLKKLHEEIRQEWINLGNLPEDFREKGPKIIIILDNASYQMGSLVGTFPDGDVAPFKLMAFNQHKGVDFFVANTGKNGVKPGKNPGDEIGQYRNLLIWLRPADQAFFWQLPKTAKVEKDDNIWFIQLEKTWLALRLINLSSPEMIEIPNTPYSDDNTYQALPTGNNYAGFALEVGEAATQGSYENFKSIFKQKSQVNLTQIKQGRVLFKGSQGQSLQFTYNQINLLPMLIRNGQKWLTRN